MPIMFSAMSYGSISYNAHESLARAASELGIFITPVRVGFTKILLLWREHDRAGSFRTFWRT